METEDDLCQNNWGRGSSKLREPGNQNFTGFTTSNQKWEEASILDYEMDMEPPSLQVFQQMKASGQDTNNNNSSSSQINVDFLQGVRAQAWDPRTMLNNLSFMEQKIHQLQDLVHLLVGRNGGQQQQQLQGSRQDDELVAQQQQQLITTDLTSIIIQLISTAGSLLPSVKHNMSTAPGPFTGQPGGSSAMFPYPREANNVASQTQNINSCCRGVAGEFDLPKQQPPPPVAVVADVERESHVLVEDHEMKDEDDAEEGENLPPGSYEILQLEKEEILAPHTHFCTICGKGFKRDANLRMHMRGHGDEYKTPAALAKPNKEALPGSEPMLIKRYSCPFPGCKRNKEHKKFQPLKTILCVKNHYKRTHCDKSFTCSRCHTKKFSVIADLKTHEKHCGKNKWLCSCGTTFSRKDKLFGHIALFQGHTPAIPLEETKPSAVASTQRESYSESGNNNNNNGGMVGFNLGSATNADLETAQQQPGFMEGKISFEESFSPLSFDTCNFGGFHEFPRPMFDDSESSFQMLISSACGFSPRNNGCGSVSNTSL